MVGAGVGSERARGGPPPAESMARARRHVVAPDLFEQAVENGPLSATQFHPEKSGDAGLALLENWVRTL